jgi:hypothetical protein
MWREVNILGVLILKCLRQEKPLLPLLLNLVTDALAEILKTAGNKGVITGLLSSGEKHTLGAAVLATCAELQSAQHARTRKLPSQPRPQSVARRGSAWVVVSR